MVTPSGLQRADLAVAEGRIVKIAPEIAAEAAVSLNAKGRYAQYRRLARSDSERTWATDIEKLYLVYMTVGGELIERVWKERVARREAAVALV